MGWDAETEAARIVGPVIGEIEDAVVKITFSVLVEYLRAAQRGGLEEAAEIANHWTGSLWGPTERALAHDIRNAILARVRIGQEPTKGE